VIFAVVLAVLAGGGALSAGLSQIESATSVPGAVVQTRDPEASPFMAADWQAHQFFLLTGFIIFNLVGIGATIALIFWFLSRQVASVKGDGNAGQGGGSAIEQGGS
jgi:hypothetical protein